MWHSACLHSCSVWVVDFVYLSCLGGYEKFRSWRSEVHTRKFFRYLLIHSQSDTLRIFLYDMRACPLSLSLQGQNEAWIENQVKQVKWFVVQKLQVFARLLIHMKTH